MTQRLIAEADGGSRGNPGPAAYGCLIRDADTGEIIAQRGETIGVATNNVAEYRGLIGALELASEHAPDAAIDVRMDSKLVIEQMAGRWKIKHPDMQVLADQARRLLPPDDITWTWVPRERNSDADALANAALDDEAAGGSGVVGLAAPTPPQAPIESKPGTNPLIGWRGKLHGEPTTLVLLRHGVTESTVRKLFCGSGGADPGLTDDGHEQAQRAADWIRAHHRVDAIVSSPLRRTQDTAQHVADAVGLPVTLEPGMAEAAFGEWDGCTFMEIMERWPDELQAWLSSTAVAPPGGETFDAVDARVHEARLRLVEQFPGQTVVVTSHVTPIKMMMRQALDAPMPIIYKMELAPASITTVQWWPDGTPSLRNFSIVPD